MSEITKLTAKILQDAEAKKAALLQAGQAEIAAKTEQQKQQLEQELQARLQKFAQQTQTDLDLRVSEANILSRSAISATRQTILDELFAEAYAQLTQLPAADFDKFVIMGLQKAALSGRAELILGADSQHYATKRAVASWQAVLPELALTISPQTLPNQSGFVLRQDYLEFNFLFADLLSASEEELSMQLLQLIFEE